MKVRVEKIYLLELDQEEILLIEQSLAIRVENESDSQTGLPNNSDAIKASELATELRQMYLKG